MCIALCVANIFFFSSMYTIKNQRASSIHFLNVGQGDAELVSLSSHVDILIDGGPENGMIVSALRNAIGAHDMTIDMIIASHIEADHIGGLIDVVKLYNIGAFVFSGREANTEIWNTLKNELHKKHIPILFVQKDDYIRIGKTEIKVYSPDIASVTGKISNDSALVLVLRENGISSAFMGDVSEKIETELMDELFPQIDILKIAHHGSKFSSSEQFLRAVKPKIAVIEVGKNSYGHPAPEILRRLASNATRIFRTDVSGNITLKFIADGKIGVVKEND